MRPFNKILSLLLALILVFGLAACGSGGNTAPANNNNANNANEANTVDPGQQAAYPERDVDLPTEIPQPSEDSVQIHYQRSDNKYSSWALWLWDPEGQDDGLEDEFNYQDDYGVIAYYPLSKFGTLSGGRIGLIVKTKGSWTKDGTDSDRFIVFNEYQKDANGVYHVYLAGGDEHMYKTSEKIVSDEIKSAVFRSGTQIRLNCSNAAETYKVFENGELIAEGSGAGRSTFSVDIPKDADFTKSYSVEVIFRASGAKLTSDVSVTGLYSTDSFNDMYYYDGELGAIYSAKSTTFKVWSPVSEKIVLRIFENGTPVSVSSTLGNDTCTEYEMAKGDKGVFSCKVDGDLGGKYYTYVVYNSAHPEGAEVVDPYAKSAGINGLRGMIVDFSKTDPKGWDAVKPSSADRKGLTVWEMHIADITSSKTWTGTEANRTKYLGVIEKGTTYTEGDKTVKTGFDHIVELGVNAVQLQPIFDQANSEATYVFNWGYNPLNYNVLEGMYSSDPYDGYARIKEFKQLVQAFSKEGIGVIMDVVYNHVNGAVNSNFDILMPGYYYRYKLDGSLSNGSGCGNETASENAMMRKFIIDSVTFWTKEYKLSGFRFDLMGLHDIETMDQVTAAAKKINKNIVIYGEPWTGGGTTLDSSLQAVQANANSCIGYGQFNDQIRDGLIKGGLNSKESLGWVTGTANEKSDVNAIVQGISGITAAAAYTISDPNKSVTYATCHDNYTLWDRCVAAGIKDEDTIRKMCVLANAVVLTSDGTGFILSGEEMLRTKGGDSNSYQSPDPVNSLDYSLKIKNADVFNSYKTLVALKKTVSGLSDGSVKDVQVLGNGAVLSYTVKSGKNTYLIIHANGSNSSETIDTAGYTVVLDTLGKLSGSPANVTTEKYQTIVLKK